MCDDARDSPSNFPESRVKRCQIKYKMRESAFRLQTQRRGRVDAHFLLSIVLRRVCVYFFDVRVLCARVPGIIRNLNRRKEVKISRISAFLRRLFRKLKDVFFLITRAFFLLPLASDVSDLTPRRQTRETPRGSSEKKRRGNASSSHREGRETIYGRGEDTLCVLRSMFSKKGSEG